MSLTWLGDHGDGCFSFERRCCVATSICTTGRRRRTAARWEAAWPGCRSSAPWQTSGAPTPTPKVRPAAARAPDPDPRPTPISLDTDPPRPTPAPDPVPNSAVTRVSVELSRLDCLTKVCRCSHLGTDGDIGSTAGSPAAVPARRADPLSWPSVARQPYIAPASGVPREWTGVIGDIWTEMGRHMQARRCREGGGVRHILAVLRAVANFRIGRQR